MRHIEPAMTILDYMDVRRLRNANRHFMTGSTDYISVWQQFKFYLFEPNNVYLYVCTENEKVIGYLLLRRVDKTFYITEVVDEEHRGKKVASDMIRFAQTTSSHLTAEILKNNMASIRLHESCGFTLTEETTDKKIYVWRSRHDNR